MKQSLDRVGILGHIKGLVFILRTVRRLGRILSRVQSQDWRFRVKTSVPEGYKRVAVWRHDLIPRAWMCVSSFNQHLLWSSDLPECIIQGQIEVRK